MILGITGGTGCGKTTLLKLLEAHHFLVLDCDRIYHDLLSTDARLLSTIDAHFPGTVTNGVLDRKKLGAIVFAREEKLSELNAITHSAVKAEVLRLLTPTPPLAAIDAIGLFESGLSQLCQLTVAVTAPEALRVQRLMARDGISEAYARARIAAQKDAAAFSALCDVTLENDGSEEAFYKKCLAFLSDRGIINV